MWKVIKSTRQLIDKINIIFCSRSILFMSTKYKKNNIRNGVLNYWCFVQSIHTMINTRKIFNFPQLFRLNRMWKSKSEIMLRCDIIIEQQCWIIFLNECFMSPSCAFKWPKPQKALIFEHVREKGEAKDDKITVEARLSCWSCK